MNKIESVEEIQRENVELINAVMMVGAKCCRCFWRGHKTVLGI